jgi:two-component system NtrC family sensor kinase
MGENSRRGPLEALFDDERERHGHAYFAAFRRHLRWRLLVAYVIPLILLAAFFHYQYSATMEEGINNHLKSVAENQRNTVDLFLQERVSNLRNTLKTGVLSIPPQPGEIERALRELRLDSPAFADLGLFGPDGVLVSYAGPHTDLLGRDYSREEWFQQIRTHNKDFLVSDVYMGFRGKPHFIIAVRRVFGGLTWVLRASVDPEKFGEFVRSSHLVKEAEAFIINLKGERQTFSGRETGPAFAPAEVPHYTSYTHVFVADIRGHKSLNGVAWLNENNWAVIVRVPKDRAFAPLRRVTLVLGLVVAAALSLIVVLVERSSRKLVDRLEASDTDKEQLRRQLFNAAKLASVGEMSAGVAHEINNPLAIIHEEAGLLKDLLDPQFGQEFNPAEFRERLDAIIDATFRGRQITRNLLAFSRDHEPVLERHDMNAILEAILSFKDTEFRVSNIEIKKEFAPVLPPVLVNRNQMEQVLYNLFNNARDAIGRDGRITVRTRQADREVQIDVEDTGCGMSDEQMEKIFFPFYTTKKVGKGTGLGLSISYGIVRSFGGRIEVKSKVGEGTTFTVALPIRGKEPKASA